LSLNGIGIVFLVVDENHPVDEKKFFSTKMNSFSFSVRVKDGREEGKVGGRSGDLARIRRIAPDSFDRKLVPIRADRAVSLDLDDVPIEKTKKRFS
jgi:hypothetical protein